MAIFVPTRMPPSSVFESGAAGAIGDEGVFTAPPGLTVVEDAMVVARVELPITVLLDIGLAIDVSILMIPW